MKQLVIGQLLEKYNSEKHILLGPFCLNPSYDNLSELGPSIYLEDPYKNSEVLLAADNEVANFSRNFLSLNYRDFNKRYHVEYSLKYWKILFSPWVCALGQILLERQMRIANAVNQHGEEALFVELVKNNIKWSFIDTLDFQKSGTMNHLFNEWLFSRIIEEIKPEKWKIKYVDRAAQYNPETDRNRNMPLEKMFSRSFRTIDVNGMNGKDRLLFNIMLKIKSIYSPPKYESTISEKRETEKDQISWDINFTSLFYNLMPNSLIDIEFKFYWNMYKSKRIIVTSTSIVYDDIIKPFLAICVHRGGIIISSQHGGHPYGIGLTYQHANIIEYSQHAFITWGWERHNDYAGNFVVLPSPMLSKIKNKHVSRTEQIILVGTLARLHSHRIQPTPTPQKQINYLADKKEFIELLGDNILQNLLYRYFPPHDGAVNDKKFIGLHFPEVNFCEGDLDAQMLECKLLVVDHLGTTINKAVAANIPFIGFWNFEDSPISEEARPFFDELIEAKVLFTSASEAAIHVNKIWANVNYWWNSEKVQLAIKSWGGRFASSSYHWRWEWFKYLWQL
jgi:putative transferase (TIGR04331 family)